MGVQIMAIIPLKDLETSAPVGVVALKDLPQEQEGEKELEKGFIPELGRVVNQVARGTYRGVLAPIDLMQAGTNWVGKKVFGDNANTKELPSRVIDRLTGNDSVAKPQSKLGKSIGNIGEIVTGSVVGPGGLNLAAKGIGSVLKSMRPAGLVGLGAGLGSEGLSSLDSTNPLLRLLGGLVGGTVPSMMGRAVPTTLNLARDMFHGVDETELARALKVQEQGLVDNMPVVLSQAMRVPSNLDPAMDLIAGSRHGTGTTQILRDQPKRLDQTATMLVETLPGDLVPRQEIVNRVQQAASDTYKGLKDFRSGEVNKLYQNLPDLPPGVAHRMVSTIEQLMKRPGQSEDTIAALVRLRGKLVNEVEVQIPEGKLINPVTNLPLVPASTRVDRTYLQRPLDIKQAISDTVGSAPYSKGQQLAPPSPIVTGQLKYATGKMFDILGAASDPLRQANKRFSDISNRLVNPAKKSFIGTLAGRQGAQPDTNAAGQHIFTLLDRGTLPGQKSKLFGGGQSELEQVATMLNRQDPTIFQDAVKLWMTSKLDKITKPISNRTPDDIATSLMSVFGSESPKAGGVITREWRTTLDMLNGAGVPAKDVSAIRRLMLSAEAMANRPAGGAGGVNSQEITRNLRDAHINRIGALNFMTPLRQPALAIGRATEAGALRNADQALISPYKARAMIEMIKANPETPLANILMANLRAAGVELQQQ